MAEKEDGIYKVDTVPPPAGENDAYNAPTKVGPVSPGAWAQLIDEAHKQEVEKRAAKEAAEDDKPASKNEPVPVSSAKEPVSSSKTASTKPPAAPPKVPSAPKAPAAPKAATSAPKAPAAAVAKDAAPANETPASLPRVYQDEEEGDDAATLLNPAARPPDPVPRPAAAAIDAASKSTAPPPAPPPVPSSTMGSPATSPIAFPTSSPAVPLAPARNTPGNAFPPPPPMLAAPTGFMGSALPPLAPVDTIDGAPSRALVLAIAFLLAVAIGGGIVAWALS